MQKRLLPIGLSIILMLGLAFGFSSCIKSYTCRCEIAYSGQPGLPDSFYKEYEIKDTNKNAKSKCQAQSNTYTDMGVTTTETCDLY